MESLILPSAIQRIRSFLVEMSGMKVKPWATTEETLAALHTTLVARHPCQIFWTSLRGLLETLARDLKIRQASLPGALVDNELLDSDRYAMLLDEIRAALAAETGQPATFRRLASALSAPAVNTTTIDIRSACAASGSTPAHSALQPAFSSALSTRSRPIWAQRPNAHVDSAGRAGVERSFRGDSAEGLSFSAYPCQPGAGVQECAESRSNPRRRVSVGT
jgi:hypothetical protein